MKILALLLICAAALSGCQTVLVSHKEALLESSGFKAIPPDTPERQALLTGLPARQIVDRGYGTYVYADPLVCNCLYVGSDAAYGKFQGLIDAAARSRNGLKGSVNNTSSAHQPLPSAGTVPSPRR